MFFNLAEKKGQHCENFHWILFFLMFVRFTLAIQKKTENRLSSLRSVQRGETLFSFVSLFGGRMRVTIHSQILAHYAHV